MRENKAAGGEVALEILEHSSSVALRVNGSQSGQNTLYITESVQAYGYSREDFYTGRLRWADLIHPDDLDTFNETLFGNKTKNSDSCTIQYRLIKKNGDVVWVSDHRTIIRDENGEALYIDAVISDNTELHRAQQHLQDSLCRQEALNGILQTMQDAEPGKAVEILLERTGLHLDISRITLFEDLPGHSGCHAVYEWRREGAPSLKNRARGLTLNYRRDIPEIERDLTRSGRRVMEYDGNPGHSREPFLEGVIASAVFGVYLRDSRYGFLCFDECAHKRRWAPAQLRFMQSVAGLASNALLRKRSAEAVQRAAYTDTLTGLENRYRFDVFLQKAIAAAKAGGTHGYVLFIDMDDFKIINDGYGHDYGDALLVEVAAYFREKFGEGALYRFGGDEFVVLLDSEDSKSILAVIEQLLGRARNPWEVLDKSFYCTLSIGVVRYPDGGDSVKEVVKNVDVAMYQAKKLGKNNYVIYSPGLNNDSIARAELEHRMRASIDRGFEGFQVYYQPMVSLDGSIIGAEALLRWADKSGGLTLPDDFVPLAEYLSLIVPLGEFVLRTAARDCLRISRLLPDFNISVNVSMRQFQQHNFVSLVDSILCASGADPANLVLEVTEGLAMQNLHQVKSRLEELRALGLKIAMDDFGTGYSSLSNMRDIPFDIVKIDRSFVKDVTQDAYSKTFIRLITDLSHSIGRTVCVEGVESKQQLRYCREYGVDIIQGFYFWRPMPAKELLSLLEQETSKMEQTSKR